MKKNYKRSYIIKKYIKLFKNQTKITAFNFALKTFSKFYANRFIKKIKKNKSMKNTTKKVFKLPKKTMKYTVLKSPHVDKKAREQFKKEIITRNLLLKQKRILYNMVLVELLKN